MDWEALFIKKNYDFSLLTEPAMSFLETCFLGAPVRDVGLAAGGNISGAFYSIKNGCTCYVESTVERQFCVRLELDSEVLAYIAQPIRLEVKERRNGKSRRLKAYTPDFLVAYNDGTIEIVECKPPEQVASLLEGNPENWALEKSHVKYLPATEITDPLGIRFKVYSGPPTRLAAANLDVIYAYLVWREWNKPNGKTNAGYSEIIARNFTDESAFPMTDVINMLGSETSVPFFELLICGILEIDIENEPLSEEDWVNVRLGRASNTLIRGASADKVKATVEERKNALVIKKGFLGHELKIAEQKYIKYKQKDLPKSSYYRYKKKIEEGAMLGLDPVESLVSRNPKKGNRTRKANEKLANLALTVLKDKYPSGESPSVRACYRDYLEIAREKYPDYRPVSYQTFWRGLRFLNKKDIASAVGGRRMRNSSAPSVPSRMQRLAPFLPFIEASIDHWTMDTQFVLGRSMGKPITVRPYFSLLIDHATFTTLAWTVTLSFPSRKNIALLIRRCVEKWSRLPLLIYTDRGAEFLSNYMRDISANFGQSHMLRPAVNSRYGSEVEGFFRRMRDSWCEIHPGKIHKISHSRTVDRDKSPAIRADVTIDKIIHLMDQYINDTNKRIIGYQRFSPEDRLRQKLHRYPFPGIPVEHSSTFELHTAVPGAKTIKVNKGGLLAKEIWFNSSVLASHEGRSIAVKYDPDDPFVIYAYVGAEWYRIESREAEKYKGASQIEKTLVRCWVSEAKEVRDYVKDLAEIDIRKNQRKIANPENNNASELSVNDAGLDGGDFDPFEGEKQNE